MVTIQADYHSFNVTTFYQIIMILWVFPHMFMFVIFSNGALLLSHYYCIQHYIIKTERSSNFLYSHSKQNTTVICVYKYTQCKPIRCISRLMRMTDTWARVISIYSRTIQYHLLVYKYCSKVFTCQRIGNTKPELDIPPGPSSLGKYIYEQVKCSLLAHWQVTIFIYVSMLGN